MSHWVTIVGNLLEVVIMYNFWCLMLEKRYSKTVSVTVFFSSHILTLIVEWFNLEHTVLKMFMSATVILLCIFVLFKDKWYKKIAAYGTWMICVILAECTAIFLSKYVYGYESLDMTGQSFECLLWQLTAYILIYAFSVLAYLLLKNKKINPNNRITQYVVLYATVQCLMLSLLVMAFYDGGKRSLPMVVLMWIIVLVSILMGIMIYRTVKLAMKKTLETEFLQSAAKLNDKHFGELKEQYEEYRRLRHDFRNHINILKQLSDEAEIKEYTLSVEEKFGKMDAVSYCSNLTLDTLFAIKKNESERRGVNVSYQICSMDELNIPEFDLCTLFSNLLDNAIEGAEKTEKGFVEFKVMQKAGRLVVTVKNSSADIDVNRKTTKKDEKNHGLGMGIICSIAEKYDGGYAWKCENGVFTGVADIVIGR